MMRSIKTANQHSGFSWLSILAACSLVSLLLIQGFSSWQSVKAKRTRQLVYQTLSQILLTSRTEAVLRGETLLLKPLKGCWEQGAELYSAKQQQRPIRAWRFDFAGYELSWHGFYSESAIKIRGEPTHLAMNGHFLLTQHGQPVARFIVSRLGRMRIA